MSSPNPFVSSPASSGYTTAERFSSPPSISYGWVEPLYGDEVFPPRLTHDEFAIVNPDFWDHDADKDKFTGWMRMTEVSVFLLFMSCTNLSYSFQWVKERMAVPPRTPKWLVVGQHNDHFHLWKEVHKDVAHQLNKLQLVERRVEEVERRIGSLSLQMEGVEVRVTEQEVVGTRLLRLVLWSVGGVLHLMAKVDFLQHLVTSFLSFGGGSSEGPRSPDGSDEPPSGPGPRSPPSYCPSLESLRSSQLDSPLIATPSSVRRSDSPGAFTQDEGDWLRAALQALPSPTSEDGFSGRLSGARGDVWGAAGVGDIEGGVGDASYIGVS